jgi:hypothetical protein
MLTEQQVLNDVLLNGGLTGIVDTAQQALNLVHDPVNHALKCNIIGGGGGGGDHSLLTNRDIAGNHALLIPTADSTSAIQIMQANGTTPVVVTDTTNQRIGINLIPGLYALDILNISTASMGGLRVDATGATTYGVNIAGTLTSSAATQTAVRSVIHFAPSAPITNAYGQNSNIYIEGTQAVTNITSIYAGLTLFGATSTNAITNYYGLRLIGVSRNGGNTATITNAYGVYVAPITEATSNWGLYIDGSTMQNFISGRLGIGFANPTNDLDVRNTNGGIICIRRNDSALANNETLGKLQFHGNDTDLVTQNIFAEIEAQSDAGISTDAAVGKLIFKTTGTTIGGSPVERMRIDSAGNVGIGVTAPATALEVRGSIRASYDATNYTQLSATSNGQALLQANGNRLQLFNDTSGQIFPGMHMEVSNANLRFNAINTLNTSTPTFLFGQSVASGEYAYFARVGSGVAAAGTITTVPRAAILAQAHTGAASHLYIGTFGSGSLKFFTGGSNTSDVQGVIDSTGRFGIGTETPASLLQVAGGIQCADDTDAASASKVGTLRYRTSGNNSYCDMCMQTGAASYAWENIVTQSSVIDAGVF